MLKCYNFNINNTTTTTTGFRILPSSPPLLLLLLHVPVSVGIGRILVRVVCNKRVVSNTRCKATRRALRFNDEDEDEEEYGHNAEIVMLESYSQSARDEVLLVRALVDDQEAQVLVYKGFSSCLSYETCPDPSRSIIPARAVIKSIDRIKGPFDPSNIHYIEKGLTWHTFKTRLQTN